MAKPKKLLIKEKKEILDEMLTLQESIDKIDAQFSRLRTRRDNLVNQSTTACRKLYNDLERDGREDIPVTYRGHVFQIGWSGPEIEPADEL